jgi:hypothetical protein
VELSILVDQLSRSDLHSRGGLFNESRDSLGLREVDGVAALGLNHRGVRPFGHVRWASGGILLSSVATRYQLGLVLHAGSLIAPLKRATPHGTWESAQNAAFSPRHPRERQQTWLCRGTKSRLAVAASVIQARPAAGL